jgi:hypothetical protein
MYYTMVGSSPLAAMAGSTSYSWTMVDNIKRDPFEAVGGLDDIKSALAIGGSIASPSTAYLYDWNMLPLGQLLWTSRKVDSSIILNQPTALLKQNVYLLSRFLFRGHLGLCLGIVQNPTARGGSQVCPFSLCAGFRCWLSPLG